MRDKVIFFALVAFAAIMIPPIVGLGAAAIGHLVGMDGPALVTLVGSAVTATFGGVIALANLLAKLLFGK